MNRFWIPALVVSAVFSANAFAYRDCDDDVRYERQYRQIDRPAVVYGEPAVIYREAPRVVYRERIEYRDRPVYYEQAPVRYYEQPEVRYYEQPAPYSGYDERPASYQRYDGNRAVGQAVGAIAGGVIGNRFGRGAGGSRQLPSGPWSGASWVDASRTPTSGKLSGGRERRPRLAGGRCNAFRRVLRSSRNADDKKQ